MNTDDTKPDIAGTATGDVQPDAHKPLPSEQLDTMRTAMRAAIERRSVPEIEDIFAQAWRLLTSAQVSELRHKREKNIKRQYASWKIALVVERLRAQWLVETGKTALRFIRPKNTKIGAPTGLITLDAKGQPPRIGIDRKKSQQLQAFARLTEKQFQAVLADKTMPTLARIIKLYAKPKSIRTRGVMELHPITGDYDDLTAAELADLRDSLREHGLVVPIVVWRNQIVDGRHRAKLCQELGIELRTNNVTKKCPTEAEMIAHVRALNEPRRANTKPLTTAEKGARIEAALKANPERSNRQIGDEIGVSKTTVSDTRTELEATGQIGQLDKHVGKDGKSRKPKPAPSNKKRKPPSPQQATHQDVPSNEPTLFDHAPSIAPQTPAQNAEAPSAGPTDPWVDQRIAVRGSIRGLARLKDVDFGPVADAMQLEQLLEARSELDKAALTIGKWRDALDAAIARATPAQEEMPPSPGDTAGSVDHSIEDSTP